MTKDSTIAAPMPWDASTAGLLPTPYPSCVMNVWQPLVVTGDKLSMPTYHSAWRIEAATGMVRSGPAIDETTVPGNRRVRFIGSWRQETGIPPIHYATDDKGAAFAVTFTGTQARLVGVARPDGGYARIVVRDRDGKELISSTIDMYSKYPVSEVKFVTPLLARGTYTMIASVVGEGWYWRNKKGERSGSAGHAITFQRLTVRR